MPHEQWEPFLCLVTVGIWNLFSKFVASVLLNRLCRSLTELVCDHSLIFVQSTATISFSVHFSTYQNC